MGVGGEGDSHLLLPRAGFPGIPAVTAGHGHQALWFVAGAASPQPVHCRPHGDATGTAGITPPTSHFLSCDQGVESIDRPSSTLSVKVTRISLPQRAKQHVPGLEKHVSRTQEGALARVPDLVLREGQVLEDPALSGQPAPGTEVVPLRPDPASVGQDDNLST